MPWWPLYGTDTSQVPRRWLCEWRKERGEGRISFPLGRAHYSDHPPPPPPPPHKKAGWLLYALAWQRARSEWTKRSISIQSNSIQLGRGEEAVPTWMVGREKEVNSDKEIPPPPWFSIHLTWNFWQTLFFFLRASCTMCVLPRLGTPERHEFDLDGRVCLPCDIYSSM